MARIRTIKPEFFTSEDIVSLPPHARLLYIAIWCEADKEGRLVWRPYTFKLRYLPADNVDAKALCKELVDAGLVRLYGDGLAFIPQFKRHQHINPRESSSALPEPDENNMIDPSTMECDASPRVSTRANQELHPQVGREGKGKEGNNDASRHALFDTFWKAYPRKVGKDEARKVFDKRKPTPELLRQMLDAIEVQRQSAAWQKDAGQFIPHPATWINQGRWQDELGDCGEEVSPMFAGAF